MSRSLNLPFLVLTLMVASFLLWQPSPVIAQTSASESATKNLKDRIEKIVNEKRDQIQGALEDLSLQKRGFIGQVERVTEEALTVSNPKGLQIIPLDQSKVSLSKSNKAIKVSDIAVDDWVVVMGYIDKEDTFQARRILVSDNTLRPKDYIVRLGTITELSRTTLTLQPRDGSQPITVTTPRNTSYQDISGEEAERTDLETELPALVIAYQEENTQGETTTTATVIRVLTVSAGSEADE